MESTEVIRRKAEEYIQSEGMEPFRGEVKELLDAGNWQELNDRFYTELRFGTGGLRGVIGGGFNRMNPLIVRRTTQGLSDYIKMQKGDNSHAAVVAFDSRRFSSLFAGVAAEVLCGNGIKTYLFSSLRPTPELSFAVRRLGADAGIVITASHNPSQYNGYKVYWKDGSQIVAPHDRGITDAVAQVHKISSLENDAARDGGLLEMIDEDIDGPYLDMIEKQAIRPGLLKDKGRELKVVYTPLHGSGGMPVVRVLKNLGVEAVVVPEQKEPDGQFPTVKFPNPEESSALELALELASEVQADLVLGTDPDADRLGIAVRDKGKYVLITGNQLGTLLADYIFSGRRELNTLPPNPALVKTIVTTDLQKLIAEDCGARCYDTLTGFKYIAEKIREFESISGGPNFVFGGEESYGYLVGTEVRDKDAVSAAAMTVEMSLYHLTRGITLVRRLDEIYGKFGYFQELLVDRVYQGEEGMMAIRDLMDKFRTEPPETIAGEKVVRLSDYQEGKTRNMLKGIDEGTLNLPSSNVLQFFLSDGTKVTVRPSGTEPKIKFYASCRREVTSGLDAAKQSADRMIRNVKDEIHRLTTVSP